MRMRHEQWRAGSKFRNLRKFAGCENSQPMKFRNLQNFYCGPFSSVFFSSFLLALICNAEFDSNSLCLDQLNNFGINSLQKLQN